MKRVQDTLLSEVGNCLRPFGFKRNRRQQRQEWVRVNKSGRLALHVSFIEHEDDFDLTLNVGVRLDVLEDMVHQGDQLLSNAEKENTYSLGCELGNLTRGAPLRWTVHSGTDIRSIAAAVCQTFERDGIPYVERYSDPEVALSVLVGDDATSRLHSPIDFERARRAVALTKILRGSAEAQSIAKRKKAFLEKTSDPLSNAFAAFVAQLLD